MTVNSDLANAALNEGGMMMECPGKENVEWRQPLVENTPYRSPKVGEVLNTPMSAFSFPQEGYKLHSCSKGANGMLLRADEACPLCTNTTTTSSWARDDAVALEDEAGAEDIATLLAPFQRRSYRGWVYILLSVWDFLVYSSPRS